VVDDIGFHGSLLRLQLEAEAFDAFEEVRLEGELAVVQLVESFLVDDWPFDDV
jgi:hypothetical protein